jgi:HNH endonuclease/AP2 domain
MANSILTSERLHELLSCDPESGIFTRNSSAGGSVIGSVAGYKAPDNRIKIYVDGKNYNAHRLVWLYVHGYIPTIDIDHIDGDPSNNRLANLREVSHKVNLQNRKGPTKANELGVMGVIRNKERFGAQIRVDGKRVWLGTYDTPELAHSVYLHTRRKLLEGNTI